MRYSAKVKYIGKNYAGSQKQPNTKTIQGELEKAICTLTNKNIKTVFSGRTDAGVNALGQVFHFDLEQNIVASNFLNSLNELLPNDIRVLDLNQVDANFHAQRLAKGKHYQYELMNVDIDLERMQTALNYLLSEHDFSSFKNSGTLNPSKVCFIEKAQAARLEDKIVIDFVGNRFLYKMIRTIVGTLLFIEKENLPPEHMQTVLEAKDRTKAGKTVSPYGLTLIEVIY